MACFAFSNQLGRTFVLRRGGVKNNMPCCSSTTIIIIILQHFLSRQQPNPLSSPSSCFHCLSGVAWISVSGDNLVVMKVVFGNNWCDDPGPSAECFEPGFALCLDFRFLSLKVKGLAEFVRSFRLSTDLGSLLLFSCFSQDLLALF